MATSKFAVSPPPNVCAVIHRRMEHLGRDSLMVLQASAAFGAEFSLSIVARASETAEDGVFRLLAEAVRERILEKQPGRPG